MDEVLVDRARLQELEHVEKMWLNACKIGHMHLHMFVVPGESFFEHGIPRVAGALAKSWAELSRLYTEGVKMAQETTKLIEELNEAKAKAESAWQSEHCLRLSAESERDAALGAVREIMKQREAAERAVARVRAVFGNAAAFEDARGDVVKMAEIAYKGAQDGDREVRKLKASLGAVLQDCWGEGNRMLEDMRQRLEQAEAEVARFRSLAKPWQGDAFQRGAEAMREACAQWVDHWVSGHVADKLRDMPIPEEP